MKLVFGVGKYEKGRYKSTSPAYVTWRGMLRRCYCEVHQSTAVSYKGCTVSKEFLNFQDFAAWAEDQPGYGKQGWQLDKDLLHKGNKVYSPESCVYLPGAVNKSLVVSTKGALPVGVERHGPSYRAYWELEGKRYKVGPFKTVADASAAHCAGKKVALAVAASLYRSQLATRAYEALMNYDVEGRQ